MITQKEYQARRHALSKRVPIGSVCIIPAAKEMIRNGDAHYRFRQDSDFYYLTGFDEPDALLLILGGDHGQSVLFIRPSDPAHEIWTGKRLGVEDACKVLGVDCAYAVDDVDMRLPELLADKQSIYYTIGCYPAWEKTILRAWKVVQGQSRKGVVAPGMFCDLSPILSEMRLFKSPAELLLMRHAAKATVSAHQRAMRASKEASYEYQLEAELMYEFIRQGCRNVAYDSIVASGANACTLHYTQNNQALKQDELVLIDAGAEFDNYAADVTRTFPVSGHFSVAQREIYAWVLSAQRAGIACVRPGARWDLIQKTMVDVLTLGLIEMGLLKGSFEDLVEREAYKPFYMHSSGHWLGLDVHDCGQYKKDGEWRKLEPGMVLTVEPGLYIPSVGVDPRFQGIGVRIEDDILVTEDGHENLTHALVSDIDEIEALICG